MITTYPFNDSLVPLNKRQQPSRQTQRGNYEWSWAVAGFVTANLTQATLLWKKAIGPSPATGPRVLMFGADVPHLATLIANYPDPLTFYQQLAAYIGPNPSGSFNGWCAAFRTWATGYEPTPPLAPVPSNVLVPIPRVCANSLNVVERQELPASWGATDAGQGALVDCAYTNGFGTPTFAQGFPLALPNPTCGPNPGGDFAPDAYTGVLLVGYSSAVNHGIGLAAPTPDLPTPLQPAYIPVIYPRDAYTPAIRAAGNVVTAGSAKFLIMGLWDD